MVRAGALVVAMVVATAAGAGAQGTACTPLAQATFVRDTLDELYYWYRQVPDLDPAKYPTPEAYLEAARYRPLDESFSYITSRAESDAFFDESRFIGLGFSTSRSGAGLLVLQVFDGGPAAEADLDRGSRIESIDGQTIEALEAAGALDGAFGPARDGLAVTLGFTTRGGERREATLRKRTVTIPTVALTRVFVVDGRRVGYVFFRNFVRPSVAALDEAFAALREAGVDELVLDLRYNGGGLVDVAVHLASLIAGRPAQDQVFAQSRHNDRNLRLDETLRFMAPAGALGLSRVVAITSRATASASELVVNGLRPFVTVVTVGDRTYGKPVGQYTLRFCDKVFAPVSFAMTNADGQGGYFSGLPADCAAPDDTTRELGDAAEASLAEALLVASTGACSRPAAFRALRSGPAGPARAQGWASLVNAW
jgi:C-terminal processing protease CtpA/Prc